MKSSVLVTGGAGYIGSHTNLALISSGRPTVVIDDLSTGSEASIPRGCPFYRGDFSNRELLERIHRSHTISSVVHFAASIDVLESTLDPLSYYNNNVVRTLSLLGFCRDFDVKHFVFSSTAAIYGQVDKPTVSEDEPKNPLSPYGRSKLMVEDILTDFAVSSPGFEAICLRYFNVAGADPSGQTGLRRPQATHLIKIALDVALGRRDRLTVFGDDYDTIDGTGVRDYIHVTDLANAHVAALDHLEAGGKGAALNCGYGTGHSVKQVILALEAVMGQRVPYTIGPRRPGDPASSVANTTSIHRTLDWRPQYNDLPTILTHALNWERRLNDA